MSYKTYFDKIDAELLKISPRRDIMLLRVIAAVIPVVLFGLDAFYDMPVLYWLGMPFYLICLALYLEGLVKNHTADAQSIGGIINRLGNDRYPD